MYRHTYAYESFLKRYLYIIHMPKKKLSEYMNTFTERKKENLLNYGQYDKGQTIELSPFCKWQRKRKRLRLYRHDYVSL